MSIDTELAWGCFDTIGVEPLRPAYKGTRDVINDLLTLFDRYEIPVTWALVGHLLVNCDEGHDAPEPGFGRNDWFDKLPCLTGVDRNLWYAPDIRDVVLDASQEHEVGLHGYTHMPLGDNCASDAAAAELDAGVETIRSSGLDPASLVFPRNDIGHLDLVADRGFKAYRGEDARWYETEPVPNALKRPLRFADEFAGTTPPVSTPRERHGLVEIPGSQVFRPYHGGWQYTPRYTQRQRARKGLEQAVEMGGVYHLWFHPFNLSLEREMLVAELESVLSHAAGLREEGELVVLTMEGVAEAYWDGRWKGDD